MSKKRCVVVMFDTLCRHFMPSYGNEWIKAPNFKRLAERSLQFENYYVGSMPCMPARREMHTGRYNFLHRSWGPLEPFDDSMPAILDEHGIHSHKVTDHHHYWEDGGATYHQRYTTFDLVRGQEGDKWVADVEKLRDPKFGANRWPEHQSSAMFKQDSINRLHMDRSAAQPQHKTFDLGLDFLERNKDADRWFLQIETFDPHEPFFSQAEFHDLYPHEYSGPDFDWPPYREVREDEQTVAHIRYLYAALVSYCDQQLGRVLDLFDKYDLWQDTLLIVNTDHGFLMGEHDWWAKVVTPFFQEIAHIPFWISYPQNAAQATLNAQSTQVLAQTIDLAPTILDYFDIPATPDMLGQPLDQLVNGLTPRLACLYGVMGGQVNVTDGRYVYMRGNVTPDNTPLNEYTLMPTHMRSMFSPRELRQWEKVPGYSFMKGCQVMQIPTRTPGVFVNRDTPFGRGRTATLLFDVIDDPGQLKPLTDVNIEMRMIGLLLAEMVANDAPREQYERLGLPRPMTVDEGQTRRMAMPNEATLRRACVLQNPQGAEDAEYGGAGYPKMPFGRYTWHPAEGSDKLAFPNNLRLRPGFVFSHPDDPGPTDNRNS